MRIPTQALWASCALLIAACGVSPPGGADGGATDGASMQDSAAGIETPYAPLVIQSIDWNVGQAPTGHITAIAETMTSLVVFGDMGAIVFSGGAVQASELSVHDWRYATAIPAADGSGTWIVAIDGSGHVRRLTASSTLEEIADRYGLAMDNVRTIVSLGGRAVGFGMDHSVAVSDGTHVTRYDDMSFANVAGGSDRIAGVAAGMIRVFQPAMNRRWSFALPDATFVAFDSTGRLVATTAHDVYREDAMGTLQRVYQNPNAAIHGLVHSGNRIWFAIGTELGTLDGDSVARTSNAHIAIDARLLPSPSGDVWALSGAGVNRYAVNTAADAERVRWTREIQPIFVSTCSSCHRPGGPAMFDLTTFEAWSASRAEIRSRVVTRRIMPPSGAPPISDANRHTIDLWTAPM